MTPQTNHLGPGDVLHGREVYLRVPRLDELAFIRMLWGAPVRFNVRSMKR